MTKPRRVPRAELLVRPPMTLFDSVNSVPRLPNSVLSGQLAMPRDTGGRGIANCNDWMLVGSK